MVESPGFQEQGGPGSGNTTPPTLCWLPGISGTLGDSGCAAQERGEGPLCFILLKTWPVVAFRSRGNLSLNSWFDHMVPATAQAPRIQEGWPQPLAGVCSKAVAGAGPGDTGSSHFVPSGAGRGLGGSGGESAPAAGLCQPRGDKVPAGQGILGLSRR